MKARGLVIDPKLAIGDGALGFWKALRQVYPKTREQRCWVHKTANVLDKLPKRLQPEAKQKLHDIWMADTREHANEAFDLFVKTYEAKYPKAVECLTKDREVLLAFYDFPAEHWIHLRTTNPIESTFATVRLRTKTHQGERLSDRLPDDGLQADAIGIQEMEAPQRLASCSPKSSKEPSSSTESKPPSRRLKNSHTQLLTISPATVAIVTVTRMLRLRPFRIDTVGFSPDARVYSNFMAEAASFKKFAPHCQRVDVLRGTVDQLRRVDASADRLPGGPIPS